MGATHLSRFSHFFSLFFSLFLTFLQKLTFLTFLYRHITVHKFRNVCNCLAFYKNLNISIKKREKFWRNFKKYNVKAKTPFKMMFEFCICDIFFLNYMKLNIDFNIFYYLLKRCTCMKLRRIKFNK